MEMIFFQQNSRDKNKNIVDVFMHVWGGSDTTKKEVGEEILKFYNVENGNRITQYNIPTLLSNI